MLEDYIGELLGVDGSEVSLFSSFNDIIRTVSDLLTLGPGDTVLFSPSIGLEVKQTREVFRGASVAQIPRKEGDSNDSGAFPPSAALLMWRHLDSDTGGLTPVREYSRAASDAGAFFALDVSDTLGLVRPTDVSEPSDFLFGRLAPSLGIRTQAFFLASTSKETARLGRQSQPIGQAKQSASDDGPVSRTEELVGRLERATELGVDGLRARAGNVTQMFIEGCTELGMEVLTPKGRDRRASLVCFRSPPRMPLTGGGLSQRFEARGDETWVYEAPFPFEIESAMRGLSFLRECCAAGG